MMTALRTEDPAVAVAMGLCLAARTVSSVARTERHPASCGWCPYPLLELRDAVEEFNEWAGFDDRHGTTRRRETRWFAELPPDERQARIAAAQALEPDRPTDNAPTAPEAGASATSATVADVVELHDHATDTTPPEPRIPTASPERTAIDEEEYLPWKR